MMLMLPLLAQARDTTYVSGGIQHDGLFPTTDASSMRARPRPEWAKIDHLSNTYLDLSVHHIKNTPDTTSDKQSPFRSLRASVRAELTEWALPGYETDFGGYGVSHISLEATFEHAAITVGDVYGQFGSGLILSLYEDRFLGVDGALRGARVDLAPYRGIRMTLLGGKQRRYWQCYTDGAFGWNYSHDVALGADAEIDIGEWSPTMQALDMHLRVGGSYVSKYERDDSIITIIDNKPYRYRLPLWVGAGDVRAEWQMKGWDVLVEYAYKANDPCADNDYSYRPGQALLASLSYSRKGLSVLAQVKRSDNMAFRSERTRRGLAGRLNHMPAFAQQHTYALAALYPYATQYEGGEWAFQAELRYTWARKTAMGGKYGTALKIGGSHIRGLAAPGSWAIDTRPEGEYYTDVNIELNKRISARWWLNAMLMYESYNRRVVEGEGGIVRAGIAVVDTRVRITDDVTLRGEIQYLYSPHYQGQWLFALCELELFRCVSLSGQYMYNIGFSPEATHEHYYTAMATYTHGSHRLAAGDTKTRDGFNCSGGVCRYVPKQEGVCLSYSFTW